MIAPEINKMIGGVGDHFIESQNVTQECDSFSVPQTPAQEESGWTKKLFSAIKEQPSETVQRKFPTTFIEYEEPPAPFNEGDLVWFDDPDDQLPGNYRVQNCSHTHARLQGLPELVNVAWLVLVEAGSPSDADFEPAKPNSELTDDELEDMAESGFDFIPTTEPYDKANPPKQGDRVRQLCGHEKTGEVTRISKRQYFIQWDGGREVEYSLRDLQDLEIRRES